MRERQAGGNRGAAIGRLRRQLVAALGANLRGAAPCPPLAGLRLWGIFCALSDGRRWGEAGPDPISPADLAAWVQLHRVCLPPHHVAIITAMDAAWLAWVRTPEADRVVGPLTGAAFDAMLGG